MDITPIYPRVIGLDVHQAKISACAIAEQADGTVTVEHREFGAFKRDRRALAEWAKAFDPTVVVMESTGVYWKSPYAALERAGIVAWVVNARHVKAVPGRKTDIADAQWLAILARAGLLRGSFIPPAELRDLRLVARQRQKLGGLLASEKNRLHKVLTDAGIRLNVLVSDLHGQAGRAMVKALIAGQPMEAILNCSGRLQASRTELFEALQPEALTSVHRFVLAEIMAHIEELEARMSRFEQALLNGLAPWQTLLILLQTLPGVDQIGAAMLLVEIGTDMAVFGSAERKGNAWVRRLLCEFAQAAARSRCALKDKFTALTIRKGHKKSIVALAHKMLRIIYAMLSRHTPYQDRAVDYEALTVQRNAPRWIKMLVKHGFITPATA